MFRRVNVPRRTADDRGFTLVELLVVVVILGLLAAVVVFAVRGAGDKGESAARTSDDRTIRTAEETFCAKEGRYADEDELVAKGYLSEKSDLHDVRAFPAYLRKGCGGTTFAIGTGGPNALAGSSVDNVNIQALPGFGFATPFRTNRGPGLLIPHFSFDTLLWKDATGRPVPWLAREVPTKENGGVVETAPSGSDSDGSAVWTFSLRDNIPWQDSGVVTPKNNGAQRILTPTDVKFTYQYYKSVLDAGVTPVNIGASGSVRNDIVGVDIQADDASLGPNQVRFRLNKAIQTFTTTAQTLLIIPKHIWETVPVASVNAVGSTEAESWAYQGSGPYKLQGAYSNAPTGTNTYVAFEDFWAGTPFVRKLTLRPLVGDMVTALKTGYYDAAGLGGYMGIGAEDTVTDAAVGQLKSLNNIQEPGNWSRILLFNHTKGAPYNRVAFRQAATYALDRPEMVNQILAGRGVASPNGALAASNPWLAPNLPTYVDEANDANAVAKLVEAGFSSDRPDGGYRTLDGAPFTMQLYFSPEVFSAASVDWIAQKLDALGVRVQKNSVATQQAADSAHGAGDYPAFVGAIGGLTGDPDTLRTRLAHSFTTNANGTPRNRGGSNVYGWNDTSSTPYADGACPGATTRAGCFDYLAVRQIVNPDQASRMQHVHKMQELVAADMPFITMYTPDSLLYYNNKFTTWYFTPGSSPVGPNTPTNKQALVTGMHFGSKAFNPALDPPL